MLHLIRDVAVHVQSKRRSMMAEVALHGLDVVPRLERHHGERVAEGMKANVFQSSVL